MRVKWALVLALVLFLASGCAEKEAADPVISPAESMEPDQKEGIGSKPQDGAESSWEIIEETAGAVDSLPEPVSDPSAAEDSRETEPEYPVTPAEPQTETAAIPPGERETEDDQVFSLTRTTGDSEAVRIETELLRLINGEREQNGLEPLGLEETMRFAARIRAGEALESLSHTRPDDTPYHTAFDEVGFSYAGKWHGENLAILMTSELKYDAEQVAGVLFQQYVNSPGHHNNILSEHFVQTGVGVFREQDGDSVRFGAAQVFAGL